MQVQRIEKGIKIGSASVPNGAFNWATIHQVRATPTRDTHTCTKPRVYSWAGKEQGIYCLFSQVSFVSAQHNPQSCKTSEKCGFKKCARARLLAVCRQGLRPHQMLLHRWPVHLHGLPIRWCQALACRDREVSMVPCSTAGACWMPQSSLSNSKLLVPILIYVSNLAPAVARCSYPPAHLPIPSMHCAWWGVRCGCALAIMPMQALWSFSTWTTVLSKQRYQNPCTIPLFYTQGCSGLQLCFRQVTNFNSLAQLLSVALKCRALKQNFETMYTHIAPDGHCMNQYTYFLWLLHQ